MNKRPLGENTDSDVFYDALYWLDPVVNPNLGKIEPPAKAKRTGLRAFADGTNWNPGSGVGWYWWTGSAWEKIVSAADTTATPTASKIPIADGSGLLDGWITPITAGALFWDKTVTGLAVTSVTTDGEVTLDGNAHGGYDFEFIIYNTTVSASTIHLYNNNDLVATNYRAARIGAGWVNNATIYAGVAGAGLGAGREVRIQGTISISNRGNVSCHVNNAIQDADDNSEYIQRKIATVTNLTRIDIVSSVASGIGINSRFRLWRRI